MTDKLRELIELNKAVDVLCAEVDKENEIRKSKLRDNTRELWYEMWDDIERDIIPVVKTFDKNRCSCVETTYPFYKGWTMRRETNYIHFYTDGKVYLDYTGGHTEIHRYGYSDFVVNFREQDAEERAETLVKYWKERVYPMIIRELEKWTEKIVKDKIREKEIETKDLMRRLGEE